MNDRTEAGPPVTSRAGDLGLRVPLGICAAILVVTALFFAGGVFAPLAFALFIIAIFLFRAAGQEFDYVLRQELHSSIRPLQDWVHGGSGRPDGGVKPPAGDVKVSPPPYERK